MVKETTLPPADAEALAALAAAEKVTAEALAAEALAAEEAKARTQGLKFGANVLVAGNIAAQVNPLSNQHIPHAQPVIAVYDRWIEIQIEAGVLVRSSI